MTLHALKTLPPELLAQIAGYTHTADLTRLFMTGNRQFIQRIQHPGASTTTHHQLTITEQMPVSALGWVSSTLTEQVQHISLRTVNREQLITALNLPAFTRMTSLDASDSAIHKNNLDALSPTQAANLRELDISQGYGITETNFTRFSNLQRLIAVASDITTADIALLPATLKEVDISECDEVDDASFAHCTTLTCFRAADSTITHTTINSLPATVEEITVSKCTDIDFAQIDFSRFSHLKRFTACKTSMTANDINRLPLSLETLNSNIDLIQIDLTRFPALKTANNTTIFTNTTSLPTAPASSYAAAVEKSRRDTSGQQR